MNCSSAFKPGVRFNVADTTQIAYLGRGGGYFYIVDVAFVVFLDRITVLKKNLFGIEIFKSLKPLFYICFVSGRGYPGDILKLVMTAQKFEVALFLCIFFLFDDIFSIRAVLTQRSIES